MKFSNSLYCRLIFALSILLVLVAQILAPADSGVSPSDLVIPSFYYPAAWSVTIFLMIALSMRDRAILAGMIGAGLAAGALVGAAFGGSTQIVIRCAVVAAGLAPYALMFARIAANSGAERGRWIDILAVASLIHICGLGNPFFRDRTAEWLPGIVDARIAQLEEAFGGQVSAMMAQVFAAWPFLHRLSFAAYTFVQIPIVVVAAFHWRKKGADGFSILPAFVVGSMIGYVFYWLAPAIGPKAYFGADFPLLHAAPAYLAHQPLFDFDPRHARNAMPSLHITWALLIFLFMRGFPLGARIFAGVYVFLTACATLGLGEHYFMDLVVAMPLVLLVRAVCAADLGGASAERLRAGAAGLAMLVFWIGAIRVGATLAPPLVVVLTGLTLAAAFWLERALARAEAMASGAPRRERTAALPAISPGYAVRPSNNAATPRVS